MSLAALLLIFIVGCFSQQCRRFPRILAAAMIQLLGRRQRYLSPTLQYVLRPKHKRRDGSSSLRHQRINARCFIPFPWRICLRSSGRRAGSDHPGHVGMKMFCCSGRHKKSCNNTSFTTEQLINVPAPADLLLDESPPKFKVRKINSTNSGTIDDT
ncbi:hypothetical protein B0T17DRAFT_48907 [Bombardia bombarda]|uniref:Secreted protein n=1 Tax=Bombardia bombarda TaxID=252184 RepID=A0AA40CE94_9PEZI|nr:hypothetical protein B0T17DRAFT_48907 [Bombardia bombarda]